MLETHEVHVLSHVWWQAVPHSHPHILLLWLHELRITSNVAIFPKRKFAKTTTTKTKLQSIASY